jgi:hypothetical protein
MSDESGLEWQAFLYASGDLSPAESAAFEAKLESDQAAREALAEAVRTTELISQAHCQPATVRRAYRSHWISQAGWMSVGAAACLLLVVGVQTVRRSNLDASWLSSNDAPADVSAQLAADWVEVRLEQLRDDAPVEAAAWMVDSEAMPIDVEGEVAVPEWLLAAASPAGEDGSAEGTP